MEIGDFGNSRKVSWFCDFLGYEIEVQLEVEPEEKAEDYANLISQINKWDSSFFKKLEPMLFAYYENTLLMCGEEEPIIKSPENVWQHIRIGSLILFSHESVCYVMASGYCAWEEEHGLEIDVDETNSVHYLGSFISNGFHENPNKPSYGNYVQGNP